MKARYPIMMLCHRFLREPLIVECVSSGRGNMMIDLEDEAQFPLYYNNYEAKSDRILEALLAGSRTVLDLGGNIGQYALLFARHAEKVYSFEPIPEKARHLAMHIRMNGLEQKVALVQKAVCERSGYTTFVLPETPQNGGTGSIFGDVICDTKQIEVETVSLDDFLQFTEVGKIDLIKMDIEGAELSALRGMRDFFAADQRPILIVEFNKEMMELAGYTSAVMEAELRSLGYFPFAMTKRGLAPLDRIVPLVENYCFLTREHMTWPLIKDCLSST